MARFNFPALNNKFISAFKNYRWVFPWLSFVWALVSGVLIERSLTVSWKLIIFCLFLPIFSFFIDTVVKNLKASHLKQPDISRFSKHSEKIEWASSALLQMSIQYIFMFCLPFLYFQRNWSSLGLTTFFTAMTLWDPLWEKLARHFFFRAILKSWAVLLVWCFLYPFLPVLQFDYFYFVSATLIFLMVVNFESLTRFKLPTVGQSIAIGFAMMIMILDFSVPQFFQILPLSVWVKNPQIGFGILEKSIQRPLNTRASRNNLEHELAQGHPLCCLTPVVAPDLFKTDILHEWWADGKKIDSVLLQVRPGGKETNAFRTYSCKQNFPKLVRSLECRVLIGGRYRIARLSVDILE